MPFRLSQCCCTNDSKRGSRNSLPIALLRVDKHFFVCSSGLQKTEREKFMSRCKAQEFKLHGRKKTSLVKASLMLEHLWMEVVNLIENKRSVFAPHSVGAIKKVFPFFALHFHDVNKLKMNGKWDARSQRTAPQSFAWKVISGFAPLGFSSNFCGSIRSLFIVKS